MLIWNSTSTACLVASGNVSVTTVGNADNAKGASELWDALTNGHGIYVDDDPADIPSEEDVPAEAL